MIEICAPHTCSSTTQYSPNPVGKYIAVGDNPVFMFRVLQAGSGSLTMVIDSSCDDGQTWQQISGCTPSGGFDTIYLANMSTVASAFSAGGIPTHIPGSYIGTSQGPLGNKFRVECFSTSSTTPWTFQVLVLPGHKNNVR